jgi:hypothetical protein
MPKCRVAFADALARLLFDKPLADLDRSERAELNFLRALEADAADEERYEELAGEGLDESRGVTVH